MPRGVEKDSQEASKANKATKSTVSPSRFNGHQAVRFHILKRLNR